MSLPAFPKSSPTSAERLFAVLVILYSTGALGRLLQGERDDITGVWMGALATNLIWILVYTVSLLLVRYRCVVPKTFWKSALPMLLPLPVAFVSVAWSDDRLLTFLRCGALVGTTLVALYFALRFTFRDILLLVSWAMAIAAIGSVVSAVWFPSFGIGTDQFEGLWIGLFAHKNYLGEMMAISFLVNFLLFCYERSYKLLWLTMAGLSVFIVVRADSMSSFVVCSALPYFVWASGRSLGGARRPGMNLLYFGLPILFCVVGLFLEYDQIVGALGRDAALSGRGLLWALVLGAIGNRPYLGYGYEAFWRGYEGAAGDIWNQMGIFGFYSHNGFLEILLGTGLLGLVSVIVAFFFFGRHALRTLRGGNTLETLWPWAFLLYLVASNLAEASFMKSNTLPWLLYTTTALRVSASKLRGLSPVEQPLLRPTDQPR